MMAAIELSPDKATRAPFEGEKGAAGLLTREICFANGLIMRSVGDAMVISPPLIITNSEIDELITLTIKSLDQAQKTLSEKGFLKAA